MANFPSDVVMCNSSIRRDRALALFLALVAILPKATFADEPRLDDHDTLLRIKEQIENNPAPSVKLRIFGDVGCEVSDQKGATNTF